MGCEGRKVGIDRKFMTHRTIKLYKIKLLFFKTYQIRLRILTRRAQHVSLNEPVEDLLQLAGFMGAVDDVAIGLGVAVDLSAKLEAKILCRIGRGATQRARYI